MTARLMTEAMKKLIDMRNLLVSGTLSTLSCPLNVLAPWLPSTLFRFSVFWSGVPSAPLPLTMNGNKHVRLGLELAPPVQLGARRSPNRFWEVSTEPIGWTAGKPAGSERPLESRGPRAPIGTRLYPPRTSSSHNTLYIRPHSLGLLDPAHRFFHCSSVDSCSRRYQLCSWSHHPH